MKQVIIGPQVRQKQKGAGKRIALALSFMSALSLVSLSVATQHFASTLNNNPALGTAWNGWYWPWMILEWVQRLGHTHQDLLLRSGSLASTLASVVLLLALAVKQMYSRKLKAEEKLHGSARWAERKDIEEAAFFDNDGVYVGGWLDPKGKLHYLRHEGPEHINCIAPTRSGKGVGLVIPTLLSWKHSAVITDLKGELWAITAGWRKEHAGNKVIRFEPATLDGSAAWNPLDEIRVGTEYEVGDTQNLANLIVDPDGKGLESHWQKTSCALLEGLILHSCYKARNEGSVASLPEIDAMLSDPTRSASELWQEMTTYSHVNGENHPLVGRAGRDMLDRPEEEGGSVLSTAKSYLSLYRDQVVARNVSHSDFRIKDLMNHDTPVSLYIVTQPTDKARLRPLVRILVNMIIRLNADKMEFERVSKRGKPSLWEWLGIKRAASVQVQQKRGYKHRLLGMIDEFPSLGKLGILEESLAFVAGYGIKLYLISQDKDQLEATYGRNENVSSNCHITIAYAPNKLGTAQFFSNMTGEATVVRERLNESGKRGSMLNNISRSLDEVKRNLLTPDEVGRLPGPKKNAKGEIEEAGDMLIFSTGRPAIYGKQILFFQDPVFSARAAVPAPVRSDATRQRITPKPIALDEPITI